MTDMTKPPTWFQKARQAWRNARNDETLNSYWRMAWVFFFGCVTLGFTLIVLNTLR